jgi:tyrosinase
MIRTRKNVLSLPAGDETLVWYGKAIAEMQKKLIADPTSWRYQAAIHEYTRSDDPLKSSKDKLPSKSEQTKFWTQCQHGSWYFLPWHRMYLYFFEQIVLAHVKNLGGPDTWALPYWNYSASAMAALLPPLFRDATLSNGTPNPLYVADREPKANAGIAFASAIDTDITYCLMRTQFPGGNTGGSAGFGGPITKFEHGGATHGSTESSPHDSMHMAIGGTGGWMGAFTTAPLDPIFWIHHCNIDRLWEVWTQRDTAHSNPVTANWLTSVSFPFHDDGGNVVSMRPSQVLNTQAAPLYYVYDDTSDPLQTTLPPVSGAVPFAAKGAKPAKRKGMSAKAASGGSMPEMVGATASSFTLKNEVIEKPIKLQKPTGPALFRATAKPKRVFLNLEGITSKDRSVPYDVYLNLPPGAEPLKHPELRAGRLPMFGLVEASRSGRKHAKNGLHYTLEVTDLYQRLALEPDWNPNNIRVSLVPTRTDGPVGAKISRMSVYIE